MIVRMIRPEEWLRTEELFSLAFEIPMKRNQEAEPDCALHWAAFDSDGEMMSTLMVSDYSIRFDGNVCKMGGVGGVGTLPQYRRNGGIRACFQQMLPELYKREYDFSYLYPFSSCFYRKFGYENCIQKQAVTMDLRQVKRSEMRGTWRLMEPRLDLYEDIREIDTEWEKKYNLTVVHTASYWEWVKKLDPAVKQEFCYIWYREDGTPGAYTVYRKEDQQDGRNLVCSQFRFWDKEGYNALMNLFQAMATDHKYAKFVLPDDASMRYLMQEWSMGAVSWTMQPSGMVRVIRVQKVLEKAVYRGSGRIVVEIKDEMIPENNGCFTVEFLRNRAVSVQRGEALPDVQMEISAFSALICGTCDFSDAASWMEGITLLNKEAPLEKMFFRKPTFLSDYF